MQENVRSIDSLAHESIGRLLSRYYGATLLALLVNALYNLVDRFFIGRFVGSYALASLGSVYPVQLIIMALGMLIGVGGSVRISICLGQRDRHGAEQVLGHGLWQMIMISLLLMGIGYAFLTPLLQWLGTTVHTTDYARQYLSITLGGTLCNVIGHSGNSYIRAQGAVRQATISVIISGLLNILLDWLFVVYLAWGVAGAAWATVLSQSVLAGWVVYHFTHAKATLRIRWFNIRYQNTLAWAILSVGFSPCIMQMSASIAQGVLNVQLQHYDNELSVSVMAIINATNQLLAMSIVALNQAAQPIWSYSVGAKAYNRQAQCLRYCVKVGLLLSIVGFIGVELFSKEILSLFMLQDHITHAHVLGMRLYFGIYGLAGLQIVGSGYFQSVGKAWISALLALSRRIIFLMPFLFLLPKIYGTMGVWLSPMLADAAAALLSLLFLLYERKKLHSLITPLQ